MFSIIIIRTPLRRLGIKIRLFLLHLDFLYIYLKKRLKFILRLNQTSFYVNVFFLQKKEKSKITCATRLRSLTFDVSFCQTRFTHPLYLE